MSVFLSWCQLDGRKRSIPVFPGFSGRGGEGLFFPADICHGLLIKVVVLVAEMTGEGYREGPVVAHVFKVGQ